MIITGGCRCGAVRYSADGPPEWAGWCHCRDCQKESGSDRRPYMGFSRERVTIEGTPSVYHDGKGGTPADGIGTYFCPTCGTVVFGVPSTVPTHYSIYAGTLDDPSQFEPGANIFVSRRWPQAAAPVAEFAEMPPG